MSTPATKHAVSVEEATEFSCPRVLVEETAHAEHFWANEGSDETFRCLGYQRDAVEFMRAHCAESASSGSPS